MKDRVKQALQIASKLNEKDAARVHKIISKLQRRIQDATDEKSRQDEIILETLYKLNEVHFQLLNKLEEELEIDLLEKLTA